MIQREHRKPLWLAAGCAVVVAFAGCGDSARKPVAYHPASIQVTRLKQPEIGVLPLSQARGRVAAFALVVPAGSQLLAQQVEAVFAAGEMESRLGNTDGAQKEFDRALDLLLASGFDLAAEPDLSALFDRVISAMPTPQNGADETAEASGEQQNNEPSPLDEITAIVNTEEGVPEGPADPRLRTRAEGEIKAIPHDLPLTVNDAVLSFLNFFQTPRGRAIVETGLRRAGRYRLMIERVLQEEGLPIDLMYLAQAESAFQPQALSRAGARGLWQFMSFRGKQYGLEHSWWVDERQDPEKATHAAAHHLRDLYNMFGDWYLVMAAYNSGPGTVQHAVERTGYADFWDLYKLHVLPKETRNYVPIILAMTLIAKDPARYGVDVQPDEPLRADAVRPGHPVDLRLVAETMDVDVDTLRLLNPQLLHLTTPNDPQFVLQLPAGAGEHFQEQMADIPQDKWLSWRLHRVEDGDTLSTIARKYQLSPAALADVNGLTLQARLETDQKVIIPLSAQTPSLAARLIRYRARKTDTLQSIADEFDVSVAELRKWNRLPNSRVVPGMRLKIYPGGTGPAPVQSVSAGAPRPEAVSAKAVRVDAEPNLSAGGDTVVYRVRAGETLWSIAQAYQTTIEALRAGNRFLFSRPLQAGDTLTILHPH
jgi:membrane-bound lytic murein transglycosylase D